MEESLCSEAPGHEVCGLTIVDTVCTSPTFLWRGLYSFKLFAACNQGGKTFQSFFSGQLAPFISFSSRSPDTLVQVLLTLLLRSSEQSVTEEKWARRVLRSQSLTGGLPGTCRRQTTAPAGKCVNKNALLPWKLLGTSSIFSDAEVFLKSQAA